MCVTMPHNTAHTKEQHCARHTCDGVKTPEANTQHTHTHTLSLVQHGIELLARQLALNRRLGLFAREQVWRRDFSHIGRVGVQRARAGVCAAGDK